MISLLNCFNPSYGLHALRAFDSSCFSKILHVSIPHMGCMPYGLEPDRVRGLLKVLSFNPSYGLHALRALDQRRPAAATRPVSIPHMGCMPYGLIPFQWDEKDSWFQSLIWVACPTGGRCTLIRIIGLKVSIPHMGCMPYGRKRGDKGRKLCCVSIPHMGCMPYGPYQSIPSSNSFIVVSIPHMGCMPYGRVNQTYGWR